MAANGSSCCRDGKPHDLAVHDGTGESRLVAAVVGLHVTQVGDVIEDRNADFEGTRAAMIMDAVHDPDPLRHRRGKDPGVVATEELAGFLRREAVSEQPVRQQRQVAIAVED